MSLNLDQPANRRVYKVVLIGEASVGKTSLLDRMLGFEFTENMSATIGVDFQARERQIGHINFKMQIWDSAGQERFRALSSSFFRGANAVIFVYDVNNVYTFDQLLEYWIPKVNEECTEQLRIRLLVGNKTDLLLHRQPEPIPTERVQSLAKLDGWMHARTSAKHQTKESIIAIFEDLQTRLIQSDSTVDTDKLYAEDSALKEAKLKAQMTKVLDSSSSYDSDLDT